MDFRSLFRARYLLAVDDVSLRLGRGEIHGIVGESGCGKTTLANLLVGMLRPCGGRILFDGADITGLKGASWRSLRRDIQMIYQNPQASLDPRIPVVEQVTEAMAIHGVEVRGERRARAAQLLEYVGIDSEMQSQIPGHLSGGQAQRVAIARALAVTPRFLVADEPVSALDVSVQAQILELLAGLQTRAGLTMLLISHDLRVVASLTQRVSIMYVGKIVESGPTEEVFSGDPSVRANRLSPWFPGLFPALSFL